MDLTNLAALSTLIGLAFDLSGAFLLTAEAIGLDRIRTWKDLWLDDRDGQTPDSDAHRAQTHGTRGVAGGHPAAPHGGPHVGAPCLAGCHRSGRPLSLSLS